MMEMDALALEALLELSQKLNPKNKFQLDSKKFPLLDKVTVESAMVAMAFILENKQKLRTPCTNLVKKWCDVRDIGVSCIHLSWMGTESGLSIIDSLLAVCCPLVNPNSTSNLLSLELHQQQAICLAILCLVDKSEKAKKLAVNLFEFIVDHPDSIDNHSDFLAEIWKLRGLLGLSLKQIELIIRKCPCGLEKELVRFAANSINRSPQADIFGKEEDETSLINLCISSPIIFQVTTSILMQLIQKSQAHQEVLVILTDFVERCIPDERNIVKLFPVKCQVPLALLSVSPEESDCDSCIEYLLNSLSELPLSTSILLLILYPQWLPLLESKV